MFTPEFREELAGIVREVVTGELQQFAQDFGNDLERALTVAFEPCLNLLKTIDRNQNIISDGNDVLIKAIGAIQHSVRNVAGGQADDEPWRASLRDDDDGGE